MSVTYRSRPEIKAYIYRLNYRTIDDALASMGINRVTFYEVMRGETKSYPTEQKLESFFRCSMASLKKAWDNRGISMKPKEERAEVTK